MSTRKSTTDFGFQQIPKEEKVHKVKGVFDSVASKYDLMNDLMSLGVHRLWKKIAVELSGIREGYEVLDIAGGTGDLTTHFLKQVGKQGHVILFDINREMLEIGRDRLTDKGLISNLMVCQGNAECLPFQKNYFNCISIGFGLRNVTDKQRALESMFEVLQPGGRLIILEFSKMKVPFLKSLYDTYSFNILPWLGKVVAGDKESYQYLAESIRMHPDQETLKLMMEKAGFEQCEYFNLSGGIVAIHRGYKV